MTVTIRKRSPRAPSIALGEAIEKTSKIYDKERCHAAPIDLAAQHIGYKDAGNGSALSTLASLKYYGLVDRPKDGMLAVTKDYESYRFAPNETIREAMISKWLKSPAIFADLLEKYAEGLPSDANIKFDLIQRGFVPGAADLCLQVFRRSVEFARYFEQAEETSDIDASDASPSQGDDTFEAKGQPPAPIILAPAVAPSANGKDKPIATPVSSVVDESDRIPIRLTGGRRAWIHIPTPFFQADKERLKKQIDLLLTDDEGNNNDV